VQLVETLRYKHGGRRRSKASACDLPLSEIASSDPAGGTDVYILCGAVKTKQHARTIRERKRAQKAHRERTRLIYEENILDWVFQIAYRLNPSCCIVALGSTQPPNETGIWDISWGVKMAGA
jgi:hypothetical protein